MAKGNDGERWHFVYRTTNKVNGKYYIGVHSTWKLDDGYLGSGKRLKRAIIKHGLENFTIEILQFFETRNEALAQEKELVTEKLVKDPMCMNLCQGGQELDERLRLKGAKAGLKRSRWLRKNDPEWKAKEFERSRSSMKRRIANGKPPKFHVTFEGKSHSEESKRKIGDANRIHQRGEKNSQFGSLWITDGINSKKIRSNDLIPEGWRRGRTRQRNLEQ